MPEGTNWDEIYKALLELGYDKETAAKIASSKAKPK